MNVFDILVEGKLTPDELKELRQLLDTLKGNPEYEDLVKKGEELYKINSVPDGPVDLEEVIKEIYAGTHPLTKEIDNGAQELSTAPYKDRFAQLGPRREFWAVVTNGIKQLTTKLAKQHHTYSGEYWPSKYQKQVASKIKLAVYGWMTEKYLERSRQDTTINMSELIDGAYNYYLQRKSLLKPKPSTTTNFSNVIGAIKGAKGVLNDNESAIFKALKNVKNPEDWKKLKADFKSTEGEDLVAFLKGFLNDAEMEKYVWRYLTTVGVSKE